MDDEYRHIPIDPSEIHQALSRPKKDQTPIPHAGDMVFFRYETWGDVTEAKVIEVQPADDFTDHYICHVVVSRTGQALTDELGRYVTKPAPDPWPKLTLRTQWGICVTREARVRGSAGWLPLDWRNRRRPIPPQLMVLAKVNEQIGRP